MKTKLLKRLRKKDIKLLNEYKQCLTDYKQKYIQKTAYFTNDCIIYDDVVYSKKHIVSIEAFEYNRLPKIGSFLDIFTCYGVISGNHPHVKINFTKGYVSIIDKNIIGMDSDTLSNYLYITYMKR